MIFSLFGTCRVIKISDKYEKEKKILYDLRIGINYRGMNRAAAVEHIGDVFLLRDASYRRSIAVLFVGRPAPVAPDRHRTGPRSSAPAAAERTRAPVPRRVPTPLPPPPRRRDGHRDPFVSIGRPDRRCQPYRESDLKGMHTHTHKITHRPQRKWNAIGRENLPSHPLRRNNNNNEILDRVAWAGGERTFFGVFPSLDQLSRVDSIRETCWQAKTTEINRSVLSIESVGLLLDEFLDGFTLPWLSWSTND